MNLLSLETHSDLFGLKNFSSVVIDSRVVFENIQEIDPDLFDRLINCDTNRVFTVDHNCEPWSGRSYFRDKLLKRAI